jgi:hypothetical protein
MAELSEEQILSNAQDILQNKKPVSFDRDIRPLIDLINMKLYTTLQGQKEGTMALEDEMAGDMGAPPVEPTMDPMAAGAGPEGDLPEDDMELGPLMEVLGADEVQAQAVYDAAQEMAETRGKSIADLAKMIGDDFNLRMRLLELAAQKAEAGAPPPMDPMMDPAMAGGPPMGAPMAPPMGPGGGMPPEGMM